MRARIGVAVLLLALIAGWGGNADAQVTPPKCPTDPLCTKTITIYNNSPVPIYAMLQANFQDPDPYLQALFQSNQSFAETHYSRVYIDPDNGIPPGGHVSVTVPWVSKLMNDPDEYADWWNGSRIDIFDQKIALSAVYATDKTHPVSIASGWPAPNCTGCETAGVLPVYSDKLAVPDSVAFQLVEFSFGGIHASGDAAKPQYIVNLYVNYNISYVDQIYLPAALTACLTEPCDKPDPSAVGYLGTITTFPAFRTALDDFINTQGWPRYIDNDTGDNAQHPRVPGADRVLLNQIDVGAGVPSLYTPYGAAAKDMIAQWNTCVSSKATAAECPQYKTYQDLADYFSQNYAAYIAAKCPASAYYPQPAPPLQSLPLQRYVYGWVPFNSGCIPPQSPGFNSLATSPGPEQTFNALLLDYIHLQYNYATTGIKPAQRFNPYTELVHGANYLDANIYAFSVDDASSFESHPGEGLILAVGGPGGLPNPTPVTPPADYSKDFLVTLGDTIALNRPEWVAYGVCTDVADTKFSPLPPDATNSSRSIIVDTVKNTISPTDPCNITVKDASGRLYRFTVKMPVPWPAHNGSGFDPTVMSCPTEGLTAEAVAWCKDINEVANVPPDLPRFDLLTPPSQPAATQ
jgi:hypothetical protein